MSQTIGLKLIIIVDCLGRFSMARWISLSRSVTTRPWTNQAGHPWDPSYLVSLALPSIQVELFLLVMQ